MQAPHESEAAGASSDARDAALARDGDGEAYARLVRRHQATIAQQMWRFTRDPERHAELVQDVFVNAWGSLRSFKGAGPFLHWLRKIALRAGLAFWRREKAHRTAALDGALLSALAAPPQDHSAQEAGELVHRALATLPPRDRLALTLLHLEERSVAQAAALTGWSETMVKVQAWRARGKLKKALRDLGAEEA